MPEPILMVKAINMRLKKNAMRQKEIVFMRVILSKHQLCE